MKGIAAERSGRKLADGSARREVRDLAPAAHRDWWTDANNPRGAAAARRAARCLTEVLPADALGLVLYQLPLAHDIAAVAPTCHALGDAAKLARKMRPFSGEVVTLVGTTEM